MANEEKLWQQSSKVHWITSGDKNMAFFHRKASQRFRRNQIDGLRNQMGDMCFGEDNVSNIIIEYYQCLFTISNPCEIDSVLQCVPQVVSHEMNNMLSAKFTKIEVDISLQQMAPSKEPSPDGMPPYSIKKFGRASGMMWPRLLVLALIQG